jgi:hypothetical protein
MSGTGSWNVTLSTSMGPQDMRLHVFRVEGGRFSGRIESELGVFEIHGQAIGGHLRWDIAVKKPLPMTVKFEVGVEGDAMNGQASMGLMGKASVRGARYATRATVKVVEAASQDAEVGPVTGESVDPKFNDAFVEIDEWRNQPERHRYVRGRFRGTDARFSIYFPVPERYEGRFFHNTYPLITNSDIGPFPIQFDVAVGDLGFTLDSGAYYLQTNLGGKDRAPPADPAIAAYRVNAAAAKFSRKLASEMYGEHRPYGYLFGGSGGSYQVMGAAEHTRGVWDGFLPYVLGTPNAIPSMFTIRQHALRVLRKRGKLADIVDAIDPGGSGDPYATLNEEEAFALREATRFGYPLQGFWDHARLTSGYYANVAPITPMLDPSYVEDFWSKPGYLGADPEAGLAKERFSFPTTISDVVEGVPRRLRLTALPGRDFADAHLVVAEGDYAGSSIPIASIEGETIGFAMAANQQLVNSLSPGDKVSIDNSWTLAMQTYHRHQIPPSDELYAWKQFKDENGAPVYPQRAVLVGLAGSTATAGGLIEGKITAKVLVLECLIDIDALPWQADWYRGRVKAALGEAFDDNFALWFIDNANHENPLWPGANARIVSYAGALQQGLRDLATWVETGVRPSNTAYDVGETQVLLPEGALERGGVQPVPALYANGSACSTVAVGESVSFEARIEAPLGAGKVVGAEWDFTGLGEYAEKAEFEPCEAVVVNASHSYAEPGTYFPVIRVAAQRQGNADTHYARVMNLARARVVVR